MPTPSLPPDYFLRRYQFTETNHRDVYPALQALVANLQIGKTVIITGASQGIGKGIALAFAKAGASGVVLASRNVQKLEVTKAEILAINSEAKVVVVGVDTTSAEAVNGLERAVKEAFGHVDILVNNAGIGGRGLIKDIDINKWWGDLVRSSTHCALLVTSLRLLPADKRGFICSVGSYASEMVVPGASSYIMTKLAVHRFTELVAVEHPNVLATAFHPGSVMTSIVEDMRDFARWF